MLKLEYMKNEILEKYNNGDSCYKIAKELGVYEQPVVNLIKKYIPNFQKKYNYTINKKYFSSIDTEDKAYFLGFIAADGAIVTNKKTKVSSLTITLNKKDVYILKKIKDFMESNHPIKELKKNQVRFVVSFKEIIDDLRKYGISERKSLTLKPMLKYIPDDLKHHFIRGYFDGDGSIFSCKTSGVKKRKYVAIRGTEDFLLEIKQFFNVKGNIQFNTGTHQARFGAKDDVLKIFHIMYKNSTIKLERKFLRFIE